TLSGVLRDNRTDWPRATQNRLQECRQDRGKGARIWRVVPPRRNQLRTGRGPDASDPSRDKLLRACEAAVMLLDEWTMSSANMPSSPALSKPNTLKNSLRNSGKKRRPTKSWIASGIAST